MAKQNEINKYARNLKLRTTFNSWYKEAHKKKNKKPKKKNIIQFQEQEENDTIFDTIIYQFRFVKNILRLKLIIKKIVLTTRVLKAWKRMKK